MTTELLAQLDRVADFVNEATVAVNERSRDALYKQGLDALGDIDKMRKLLEEPASEDARSAPEGFVLVPVVSTKAMNQVMYDGDWTWPDLLAAAESITEDEYNTLNAMLNAAKESGK